MSPSLKYTVFLFIILYCICSQKFARMIVRLVLRDASLPFGSLNIAGDFLPYIQPKILHVGLMLLVHSERDKALKTKTQKKSSF